MILPNIWMIDFRLNSFVRLQRIFSDPCYSDFILSSNGQEEHVKLDSVQVQLKHFLTLYRLSLREVQVSDVDVILHVFIHQVNY